MNKISNLITKLNRQRSTAVSPSSSTTNIENTKNIINNSLETIFRENSNNNSLSQRINEWKLKNNEYNKLSNCAKNWQLNHFFNLIDIYDELRIIAEEQNCKHRKQRSYIKNRLIEELGISEATEKRYYMCV